MSDQNIFERLGGTLSSLESTTFGALGIAAGLFLVAPWLGMSTAPLCMIGGYAAGAVAGAGVQRIRRRSDQ